MPITLPLASILGDFGEIIAGSSPFAKFIVLVLFVLSVFSWAVMAERFRRLAAVERANRGFWERFEQGIRTEEGMAGLDRWAEKTPNSPLGAIYREFHREFWPLLRRHGGMGGADSLLQGVLRRGTDRVATREVESLEQGVTWLATLSAVAPFLGLLGTVWGIMGSFLQIGRQGTATLDAVGPGIAEALVTTVCGLFVAIPAVVGYNWLIKRIRGQESEMLRLMGLLEDRVAAQELSERREPAAGIRTGSY